MRQQNITSNERWGGGDERTKNKRRQKRQKKEKQKSIKINAIITNMEFNLKKNVTENVGAMKAE